MSFGAPLSVCVRTFPLLLAVHPALGLKLSSNIFCILFLLDSCQNEITWVPWPIHEGWAALAQLKGAMSRSTLRFLP